MGPGTKPALPAISCSTWKSFAGIMLSKFDMMSSYGSLTLAWKLYMHVFYFLKMVIRCYTLIPFYSIRVLFNMFTLCVVEAYATERANRFFRGIYQHDVFIPRDDATTLSDCLYDFVHAYLYQACVSSKQGKFDFFPLYPKVHAVHEVAHEQRRQCRLSPFTLNPAIHACSIDEDFIGRMAALSRCVSPRVIPQRTLNRYLVHIQICWARNL